MNPRARAHAPQIQIHRSFESLSFFPRRSHWPCVLSFTGPGDREGREALPAFLTYKLATSRARRPARAASQQPGRQAGRQPSPRPSFFRMHPKRRTRQCEARSGSPHRFQLSPLRKKKPPTMCLCRRGGIRPSGACAGSAGARRAPAGRPLSVRIG